MPRLRFERLLLGTLIASAWALAWLGCGESTSAQDAGSHDAHGDDAQAADAPRDAGPGEGGPGQSPFTVFHQVAHGETLNAITGWDVDHFIAVGSSEVSYVYTAGTLTRLGGDVPGSDFKAVWGSSPTDVFAAGAVGAGGGFVSHFDGHAWKTVFKAPTRLYGIWGTVGGAEGVLAVGEQGVTYGYVSGGSWQNFGSLPVNPGAPDAAMSISSPILSAITGRNVNDFTITSNGAEFFHYEPEAGGLAYYRPVVDPNTNFTAAWQDPDAAFTSVFMGANFYGLYYFAATDTPTDASVFADGSGGRVFAQISADTKVKGAAGLAIHGVWGTSTRIVAVGDDARILVLNQSSGHTGVVAGPPAAPGTYGGVWGSSLSDVWIVGPDETILRGALH